MVRLRSWSITACQCESVDPFQAQCTLAEVALMPCGSNALWTVYAEAGRKSRTAGGRTAKETQEALLVKLKAARHAGKKVR